MLTRKDFLKILQANILACAIPLDLSQETRPTLQWPVHSIEALPQSVRAILKLVPQTEVDRKGFLHISRPEGAASIKAPQAITQWNRERQAVQDRLDANFPWGMVLHWYGDRDHFDGSIEGYLRGFDSLREIDGMMLRTSAHFLVGPGVPTEAITPGRPLGIIQTQVPDADGTPFLASHLRPLNYVGHRNKEQYFVRALYQLGYADPAVHNLLQDFFDGPKIDPNLSTLAIEMCGYDFDNPLHAPPEQQIANALGVVWALMKRYSLPSSSLMGHNEIQLGKPDPGKKFMALVRYLIGARALIEGDAKMNELVFGQYLGPARDTREAVKAYFKFVRDYLVLLSYPFQSHDWEQRSSYWLLYDLVANQDWGKNLVGKLSFPVKGRVCAKGCTFLEPGNHEGVDYFWEDLACVDPMPAYLAAYGECMYAGECYGQHSGKTAIFQHRMLDGAMLLTVYGHLSELNNLEVGNRYPSGYPLGTVLRGVENPYLHFAIAYGATWETDLRVNPSVPSNAGRTWVWSRYISPDEFFRRQAEAEKNGISNNGNGAGSEREAKRYPSSGATETY